MVLSDHAVIFLIQRTGHLILPLIFCPAFIIAHRICDVKADL